MIRIFIFGLGIFLCSLGLMFDVLYINLITMGYSFLDYVKFIISRSECYLLLLGIILIIFSLEGKKIREKLLRCCRKF